jgi:hypothetical protein
MPTRRWEGEGIVMSLDSTPGTAQESYPLLTGAVNRHLAWACDFTTAGDLDSAIDALLDAYATSAELRASDSGLDG